MADTYVTMQEVAEDFLIEFQNNLLITATTDRGFEDDITNAHTDTGGTVKIRKRVRYNVTDGATISSVPDTEEKSTDLTIDQRKHVVADFTTNDLTFFTKDRFRERFIKPMATALANKVDQAVGAEIGAKVNYFNGTPGTRPSAFEAAALVAADMDLLGMPMDDRWMGFAPKAYASFISANTLQNSFVMDLSRDITRKGQLGIIHEFQSYKSIYVPTQIAGIGDSSATPANGFVAAGNVKTTVTSGNTIVVENLQPSDTGVFNPNDKIRIAGVYSVNPGPDHISTGNLMTFTITNTTPVDSTAGGEATITVSPAIISAATDPYRNISNTAGIPGGAGSAITLATGNTGAGSTTLLPYEINLAYNKGGVLFAAPPLALPRGIPSDAKGSMTDPETKVSIRIAEFYDGLNDKVITRADVIYGIDVQNDFVFGLLG